MIARSVSWCVTGPSFRSPAHCVCASHQPSTDGGHRARPTAGGRIVRRAYDAAVDQRLADLEALADDVRRGEGSVSVVARVAGDEDAAVSLDPDSQHYSASIMKLPVLIAAHRLAETGRLDLDAPVRVHDDFDSRNPGRRYTMDPDEDSDPDSWAALGTEVPLEVLVHRMVVVSGNMATN